MKKMGLIVASIFASSVFASDTVVRAKNQILLRIGIPQSNKISLTDEQQIQQIEARKTLIRLLETADIGAIQIYKDDFSTHQDAAHDSAGPGSWTEPRADYRNNGNESVGTWTEPKEKITNEIIEEKSDTKKFKK